MADDQPNKVRNPINIYMKEETANILAENDPVEGVIAGLTSLEKALKTNRKDNDKTTDRLIGYVESHLKEAKGLQRASQDPQFRKQPGSYRFFSETADKLTTTLGKTVASVTGKVSNDMLKTTKKAYNVIDAINRMVRGVTKRDLGGANKDYYRERYDFEEKHMKLIMENRKNLSEEELSEKTRDVQRDKASTARGVQQNRNVGAERGNLGVEKAPRMQGELNQVLFREKYIGGAGGGGGGSKPDGDNEPPTVEPPVIEPPVIEPPDPIPLVIEPPEPEDFFDFDEVLNKVSITAKDVANALAKEIRRDLLREALEKTDYMMEKREKERKEKEKVLAEKEEAARLIRKRANEHKRLMDYRDMLNRSGDAFLKDEAAREKAEARAEAERAKREEEYNKSKEDLIVATGALITKTLKETFNKFFNRSASEVSKTITSFMDDPLMALINQTEYGVNAVGDIVSNVGTGMADIGMGIMSMSGLTKGLLGGGGGDGEGGEGDGEGSGGGGKGKAGSLKKIGGAVAGVGAVIAVTAKVVQGVLNAGLGIFKAIYTKLLESSPVLQGFAKMFKTAVNLIFMPIGNIMGTFFMAFGMQMINFAVWFNREFPKFKYSIIGYMTVGIASILKVYSSLSSIFSAGLRILASLLGLVPGMSGVTATIKGVATLIDRTSGPLNDLATDLFKVSNVAFKIQSDLNDGNISVDEANKLFEGKLENTNTTLNRIFEEVEKITTELISNENKSWVDRQTSKGDGSFWKGMGRNFVEWFTNDGADIAKNYKPMPVSQGIGDYLSEKIVDWFRGIGGKAHGGYISASPGGTLVRLGEGTRGEYVIPEGRGGFGNQPVINIEISGNIYGDDYLKKTIERSIKDALNRWNTL